MDQLDSMGHLAMGARLKGGRLSCMVAAETLRTVRVHLGSNEIVQGGFEPSEVEVSEDVVARYGGFTVPPPPGSVDPLDWVPTYMAHAKRVLDIDKYHSQMVFLFGPQGPFRSFSGMPADQQDKFLFMNDIAAEVRRTGATGLVFIADAWFVHSSVEIPPGKRPGDMEERLEGLEVTGARSDGAIKTLVTPYTRDEEERIDFGETEEMGVEGGAVFLLPVMQAWGLPGDTEQAALGRLGRDPGGN